MAAKRSRAKLTKFVAVNIAPAINTELEAIIDAEIAKGRQGFTLSDLLREGIGLVVAYYSPNGKSLSEQNPRHKPAGPSEGQPKTPEAKQQNKPGGKVKCEIADCRYNKGRFCGEDEYPKGVCRKSTIEWVRLATSKPLLEWDEA